MKNRISTQHQMAISQFHAPIWEFRLVSCTRVNGDRCHRVVLMSSFNVTVNNIPPKLEE